MKSLEIKGLSIEELKKKRVEFTKKHFNLKRSHAVTPLENPLQIREIRRTVARLATELTKREL